MDVIHSYCSTDSNIFFFYSQIECAGTYIGNQGWKSHNACLKANRDDPDQNTSEDAVCSESVQYVLLLALCAILVVQPSHLELSEK